VRGKFITFEGPDGSGKSTQVEMLHSYLAKKGYDCLLTREPGGTRVGQLIRGIVLEPSYRDIADRAELFLILADRAQHTAEVILPALGAGKIVLCERYNDSTIAYQGYGRGLDLEETRRMCSYASFGLQPDLTFLLDVDVAAGLRRRKGKRTVPRGEKGMDRIEAAGVRFHNRVRAGYLDLSKEEPHRIMVLSSSKGIQETHLEIVRVVEKLLAEK